MEGGRPGIVEWPRHAVSPRHVHPAPRLCRSGERGVPRSIGARLYANSGLFGSSSGGADKRQDMDKVRLSEISDLIASIDPQHFWALKAQQGIAIEQG